MLGSVGDRIVVHLCRRRRHRSYYYYSQYAIVKAALILLQLILGVVQIQAALPPGAEDEIILIEHLPGRRVHLQDFFWTGVEDAPPWLDPEQILTLYETRTVHHTATVYVPEQPKPGGGTETEPRQPPIDCTSCIDPTPTLGDVDQNIGVLVGEDPGPRYWLLTVLKAGENVPPKVELRLARLYKAAFTRQQQKHLGLLPPDVHTRKNFPKRQVLLENQTSVPISTSILDTTMDSTPVTEPSSLPSSQPSLLPPVSNITQGTTNIISNNSTPVIGPRNRSSSSSSAMSLLHMRAVHIAKNKRTLPIIENEEFEELALKPIAAAASSTGDEVSLSQNETSLSVEGEDKSRLRSAVDVGLVQVRMQNTSVIEGGATRLIYTVHLGGKPVPAETAARDMALLSAQEVALELGAPVIIQSEPYLKESRPLALSRKRDAWLLIGAAGAGLALLAVILVGLLIFTKRKRAQSAVAAPPDDGRRLGQRKDEEYAPTTPGGVDNTAYTSETEGRTEATSGHRRTLSRTPGSQDTIDADTRDISSENELETSEQRRGQQHAKPWDTRDYAELAKKGTAASRRVHRANAIDRPRTPDSVDSTTGGGLADEGGARLESLESLEKGFGARPEEATGSPHSYLSMPSCKQFPNMRSVEPLSKVLEPVVVKHLDLELDSPEMKMKGYDYAQGIGDHYFARASSATKDPGVLGPIVWDLKRKRAIEGNVGASASETEVEPGRPVIHGPVGRARRRLNELLEDSFSLFGSREPKHTGRDQQQQRQLQQQQWPAEAKSQSDNGQGPLQDRFAVLTETRGKSAHVSPVGSPSAEDRSRPRTSLPLRGAEAGPIPETGDNVGPHPRGAWGSRPLSAGPFHRPALPEVEVVRVLADSQLRPEDPAVPLIAAIKKELGKFSYD